MKTRGHPPLSLPPSMVNLDSAGIWKFIVLEDDDGSKPLLNNNYNAAEGNAATEMPGVTSTGGNLTAASINNRRSHSHNYYCTGRACRERERKSTLYARHAATVKSPSLNVRLYECVVESTFSSLSPTGLPPPRSFSLARFVIEPCVREGARHPATSGRRNRGSVGKEGGNALDRARRSIVPSVDRKRSVVRVWMEEGCIGFSPLLIIRVLILREEAEKGRGRERKVERFPVWESSIYLSIPFIYPFVYLYGKERKKESVE